MPKLAGVPWRSLAGAEPFHARATILVTINRRSYASRAGGSLRIHELEVAASETGRPSSFVEWSVVRLARIGEHLSELELSPTMTSWELSEHRRFRQERAVLWRAVMLTRRIGPAKKEKNPRDAGGPSA